MTVAGSLRVFTDRMNCAGAVQLLCVGAQCRCTYSFPGCFTRGVSSYYLEPPVLIRAFVGNGNGEVFRATIVRRYSKSPKVGNSVASILRVICRESQHYLAVVGLRSSFHRSPNTRQLILHIYINFYIVYCIYDISCTLFGVYTGREPRSRKSGSTGSIKGFPTW